MRFAKLIVRNLFRNRLRTALTLLLLTTIFFFVAVMLGILHGFTAVSESGLNRLVVENAMNITNRLPVAYEQRLRRLPGVAGLCKQQWVGNYYRDKKNYFPNFAVDHDHFAAVFDDYKVEPGQLQAWEADRRGALVGRELMERFGWKLGQRITLLKYIYPYDLELTIRGIIDHPVAGASLYLHWDYYSEMSTKSGQNVGTFWLKVKDRSAMVPLSEQIDAMFKNSESPTETYTEKDYQAGQASLIGNVSLLFTALSACAIVMVVILAAITMSMSARERVTEVAVLKAIGFSKGRVLALMLAEFVLLTLIGGLCGTLAAKVIFSFADMTTLTDGAVKGFAVTAPLIGTCALLAAAVGMLAGGLPALRATRLSVVDGLRRIV
jgi:putative ABC transport system permease protein